ncbi:MAG: aldehyde dehydrogenase family protein [Smithellaceae bacterium]|nr:aldehyde dehydrogenase family protein [Smithellaceae bacterium]
MSNEKKFYINGYWVDPVQSTQTIPVINPATEQEVGRIAAGSPADVDVAVQSAHRAFDGFSRSSKEERVELLKRVIAVYERRMLEIAAAITMEMGAPKNLSESAQAMIGLIHLQTALDVLEGYSFEEKMGTTRVLKEPIGVCALIAPWNWPMNQAVCKIAPALAAGCTMILKPSQLSPLSALILAEIMDEAAVPPGVFNLINGTGSVIGESLSSHPQVDMVSFTGSTGVGAGVACAASGTIKRVSLELGGKSANILLDDVNLEETVSMGVYLCMHNSGQTCIAPTRMLIPESMYEAAIEIAAQTADSIVIGDPQSPDTFMGPVSGKNQFETVSHYIEIGLSEGARLIAGGLGRPQGLDQGFYIKPTVFAGVNNSMRIAQEEIFGPVICMIPYKNEEEAIAIANDSAFGLSGYVQSASIDRARDVAKRMRTGMVHLNGAELDPVAPFGGYKQSGNGREWGRYGLEDYLETKSIMGFE